MPDAMRPIFKSWGGGRVEAKNQKSQSMFITSFDLFDISMKGFFRETGKKVSKSWSKNKEWEYEEVELAISTFKLPLNKRTLRKPIYFNPLVEEVAEYSLPITRFHWEKGGSSTVWGFKSKTKFGSLKTKTWDYIPFPRNWVTRAPVKRVLS